MDLQSLNAGPTPVQKGWLNPIVGKLTAGTIVGNVYSTGPAQTFTTNPVVLTAAQAVNGLIGINPAAPAASNITMPPAADLDNFVELKSVSFKTVICFSLAPGRGVTNTTISYNGIVSFDGQTGLTFDGTPANVQIPSVVLNYYRDPVAGWTIYPEYSFHHS
jgi:hypothetical protein